MPAKLRQPMAAGDDVRHMNVVGRESRLVEHRGGLSVAVDALLPQYGHLGSRSACDARRGDVFLGIEAQCDVEARIRRGRLRRVFLISALRVVAQPPHPPGGLRPGGAQIGPGLIEQPIGADMDTNPQLRQRHGHPHCELGEPVPCQHLPHLALGRWPKSAGSRPALPRTAAPAASRSSSGRRYRGRSVQRTPSPTV